MRQQGEIIRWLDDKGFGFISVDGSKGEIFVHITAFPKGLARPVIGEVVMFDLVPDSKNCFKAKNVSYLNRLHAAKPSIKPTVRIEKNNHSIVILVLLFACCSLLFYQFYKRVYGVESPVHKTIEFTNSIEESKEIKSKAVLTNSGSSNSNSISHANDNAHYQCSGKTRCTEMNSCDEAKFYLSNCPGTIADGDGDGIPCEDQWCGH